MRQIPTGPSDLPQMEGYACAWCQIILATRDLARSAR
jgi:hypothetical protein